MVAVRRAPGTGGTRGSGPGTAERIERVMTMTETELKISEEPLAERVLRQVRAGTLDESRLLPSAEKRSRDVAAAIAHRSADALAGRGVVRVSRVPDTTTRRRGRARGP